MCSNHMTDRRPPLEIIIEKIEEIEGEGACSVKEPLYSVVDVEALEGIFAGRQTNGTVTFDWDDRTITVCQSGSVKVI